MEEVPTSSVGSPISDISIIDIVEIPTTPTPATPILDMAVATTDHASNREPEPGLGTSGRFFRDDERKPSIVFKIASNPSKPNTFQYQDWVGILEVKCWDVPRLMREGFHWDVSNVVKEEGYVENGVWSRITTNCCYTDRRWYFLTDTHKPQRWMASLSIEAPRAEVFYTINLSHISRERIKNTVAINEDGNAIYWYVSRTKENPMMGCNTIYEGMPMEGFWPWPRRESDPPVDCDDEDENGKPIYKSSEERMSQDNSGLEGNIRGEGEGQDSKLGRAYNTALDDFCTVCCMKLDNDFEQLNIS
ncbi:hypothetical protein F5Y03DRAFT_408222 [Xylaria venustula]|nr:hypothetical protein F5Y03DRAFT_408222 [Xylaria venustula]